MAKKKKGSGEKTPEQEQAQTITSVSLVLGTPALIALAIYAIAVPETASVLAIALLTAASAFAAGALLGFLFGIPRTAATNSNSAVVVDDGPKPVYEPNTNLEQISDWLTKILVGVGLVQIGQIGGALDDLASGLEPGLGEDATGHAVAVMLLVSFAITGFLSAYLFTRLRLQNAFEPFRKALKKQEDTLTNALPIVRRQLDPGGEERPSAGELRDALSAASSGIREEAFYLARDQRRANWRIGEEDGDEFLVELTIPVFDALIALDEEEHFHRTRAELGYALKDKTNPTPADYARARDSLTKAIEIRDAAGVAGFSMYEFNRAYCNIKLDPALEAGRQCDDDELAAQICADLTVAAGTDTGRKAIENDHGATKRDPGAIEAWLTANRSNQAIADRVVELLKIAQGT